MKEAPATVSPASPEAEDAPDGGFAQCEELDVADIPATDIVFECPHCAKSLSIDQRGAGLVIRCTQCGEPVTVPIPEGMEIEDFDATPEELSAQLLQTRQSLSKAQKRAAELSAEVESMRERLERYESAAAPVLASLRDASESAAAALAAAEEAFATVGGGKAP